MLLLTGATGLVGSRVLRRLTAARIPVRCLVRDPRRLGPERVRVQIALGDLADPPSFRNALRGVTTVVHLAAAIRDQPRGSIEELNGIATWRMVQAAEAAGVRRFVFFSALGASAHDRTRFLRAKALAEEAVVASDLEHVVVAPSIIYAPGDVFMTLLSRMAAIAPVVPVSGSGRAEYQPIWADDVADCVMALLRDDAAPPPARNRYELGGPETLTYTQITELLLRAAGRPRRLVHVPTPIVSRALRASEAILKSKAPATWDEAELMEVSLLTARGVADAQLLGVEPSPMRAVLKLDDGPAC
ncbi:nucleotide-sugar epimerase [Baekduia alba]|uniref:complex I NDUFA9 subunit family protein n=1 Tax=Baekduia alba TaxID=2997333 RepID=UPI00233FA873|nr:complex I NDUFA9 subunit family protein [Baekduia alba]WCB96839.1 nucleotide-sugar epimerase [Baekduia alba]